jgi:hypothetical protein
MAQITTTWRYPITARGNIQRQKSDSEERDTVSLDEVGKGIYIILKSFD